MQRQQLHDLIIDKIDDIKGLDIVNLDVRGISTITDALIICTGTSNRHVRAIADHVSRSMRDLGVEPLGIEGGDDGEWVLVDLGEVIVHVMQEEQRALYQLEKLWSQAA